MWGWNDRDLVGRQGGGKGANLSNTLPVFPSPILTSSSQPGCEVEMETPAAYRVPATPGGDSGRSVKYVNRV